MKILVIGQAPPAVKQVLPYDTTMFYDWIGELGIKKEDAWKHFEFDAVYDQFPGKDSKGHKKPTEEQMEEYWNRALKEKVKAHKRILILGTVAWLFLGNKPEMKDKNVAATIHPSKFNHQRYNDNKQQVLNEIKSLL